MTTQAYRDYIKSDRWAKKRQAVFAYYGKRCYACTKQARILHVHHLSYARLGREAMNDLMPLCVPCHREVTKLYRNNRRLGNRNATLMFVKRKRAEVKNATRPSNRNP